MALQNLCLDIIVSNFERYFLKFSNSEDAVLKRRYEFLQRKFSYEIASSLSDEGRMKAEYIDFLVNKHLKVLDFRWFLNSSWDEIVAKFKEVGPDLQTVYFCDDSYDMPLQDLMSYLPNLEVMTFQRCCTNELLKGLSEFCDNIREIDVSGSESVTNEGIKQLCFKENGEKSCGKLRKLLIACSGVTEEGVVYIMTHMPSIEIIDYLSLPDVLYSIHKKDLPLTNNIKPYNLQNLNLLHCSLMPHFTDLLKVCLYVCPHLKSLSCPFQKQEHLKILSELSELEKLHLDDISSSEIQINEMLESNGKKLSSLSVSLASMSVFALSKNCPVLKYLHLNQVDFMLDSDSVSSPVFPCLETCIFDSIIYDANTCKSISHLLKSSPKLDNIAFKRCILWFEVKAQILKCCEQKPIKKINFSGSVVDVNFIKDILCNCRTLISITLDSCGLNKFEELELEDIAQSLPNNPELLLMDDDLSLDDSDEFYSNIYEFEDDYDDYDDYSGYDNYDDDDDDDPDYEFDPEDYYGGFFD